LLLLYLNQVSKFQGFKVSRFQGFRVSKLLRIFAAKSYLSLDLSLSISLDISNVNISPRFSFGEPDIAAGILGAVSDLGVDR
jgi:hypothetical protein